MVFRFLVSILLINGKIEFPMRTPEASSQPLDLASHKRGKFDQIIHYNNGEAFWALAEHKLLVSLDNGKQWRDITPSGVSITAAGDGSNLYAIHQSVSQLDMFQSSYSIDPKDSIIWMHTILPTQESWELEGTPLFSKHFVGDVDWLLIYTDTGKKALYQKSRNDSDWKRIGDISSKVTGLPTGIAINKEKEGWITAKQGMNDIPLYRTKDGGTTWTKEKLPLPKTLKDSSFTGNAYTPIFDEEDDQHWMFPTEIVQGNHSMMLNYETMNAGDSWTLTPDVLQDVKVPPAYHLDPTYFRDWALSKDGSTLSGFTFDSFSIINHGPKPSSIQVKLKPNLNDATEMYLRLDGDRARGWVLLNGEFYVPQGKGENWIKP
jgi:hypothetical protein